MERREFIKKASLLGLGIVALPILPKIEGGGDTILEVDRPAEGTGSLHYRKGDYFANCTFLDEVKLDREQLGDLLETMIRVVGKNIKKLP